MVEESSVGRYVKANAEGFVRAIFFISIDVKLELLGILLGIFILVPKVLFRLLLLLSLLAFLLLLLSEMLIFLFGLILRFVTVPLP